MTSKRIIITLILVIIGAILIYIGRTQIYTEMENLKLIPEPEHFVELYFTNPLAIPHAAVPNVQQPLAFTLHDVGGSTTTYPYEIYFEHTDGTRDPLATGNITLGGDETRSITVTYTLTGAETQGEVVVTLTSLNQQIDFHLPDANQ